jgi:5-methylcytosine-specific restriction endonuclease McrA
VLDPNELLDGGRTDQPPLMKTCTKCQQTKPLEEFYAERRNKDGRIPRCKSCVRAQSMAYHWAHWEESLARIKAYQAAHFEELKVKKQVYRAAHREQDRKTKRAWAEANGEKMQAWRREYYAAHREEKRLYNTAYHAAHREELRVKKSAWARAAKQADPQAWRERGQARMARWRAANPAHAKAQAAARYQANQTAIRQKHAAHYATHREQLKGKSTARYRANPEAVRRVQDAWRRANSDKVKAYEAKYRRAHPEVVVAQAALRRARKRQAPVNDFTAAQWRAMKALCDYHCVYCGKRQERLTQDHVIPLSKGGSHTWDNIVPACKSCNSKKHTKSPLTPVQGLLNIG